MATFKKIKITIPYALTMPKTGSFLEGDPNPYYDLVLFLNDSVDKTNRYTNDGITYTYDALLMLELISIEIVQLILNVGGDISNLPLYLQVLPTDTVHPYIQNPQEDTHPTYQEWIASNQFVNLKLKEDGYYYIDSAIFNGNQNHLPASVVMSFGPPVFVTPQVMAIPDYVAPIE